MIKIGFLVGGNSVEHDFTFKSLNYLIKQIQKDRISPLIIIKKIYYISKDFKLYVNEVDANYSEVTSCDLIKNGVAVNSSLLPSILLKDNLFIFSLLQGAYGEDGHMQALSYLYRIPGNFDNVAAAAIACNKWAQSSLAYCSAKEYLTPILTRILSVKASIDELEELVFQFSGKACILKPNSLGGSILVNLVEHLDLITLKQYVKIVKNFDNLFLVQERIFGHEYACCCLIDSDQLRILPLLKVDTEGAFMDFNEKYKINQYRWIFHDPPQLIQDNLRLICEKINNILGFNTYCRFDFIINGQNIFLLEINNVPGIYENSVYNRCLDKANLDVIDLILLTYNNWKKIMLESLPRTS